MDIRTIGEHSNELDSFDGDYRGSTDRITFLCILRSIVFGDGSQRVTSK